MTGWRRLAWVMTSVTALLATALPVLPQVRIQPSRRPEMVPPPQAPPPVSAIRAEPVAETRLIMEGLSQPNFQGLQKNLRQEPANVEAWTFVRGQALLVAEAGNLLILRPPHNEASASWLEMAATQRGAATRLARAAGERDYVKSRVALADLTNACNRCHRAFRVATQVDPLPAEK